MKRKKPIRSHTKPQRKPTGESDFLKEILDEREPVSFVSGLTIEGGIANCAHVLPKGKYPEFKFDPENIVLLTVEEHRLFDQGTNRQMGNYEDRMRRKGVEVEWDKLYELRQKILNSKPNQKLKTMSLKDFWKKIKTAWRDFWNGRTVLNELIGQSEELVEDIKSFTEPGGSLRKITEATPMGWDDTIVKTLHSAATNTLPYAEIAGDVEECLDERKTTNEQIECLFSTVRDHSDDERAKFYLKMASAILRQLVFDAKGVWIDKDKAEQFLQTEHDKRRTIEAILRKE